MEVNDKLYKIMGMWIGATTIFLILSLAGCNGGGGGGTTSPPSSNVINGLVVPPDPGAAANITVAGIDSDSNGIRDEVDRFIATKFGANPNLVAAAQASARAVQGTLLADPTDVNAAFSAMANSADAGVCAGRQFRANGITASGQELTEIFLLSVNTPERIAQKKAVAAKAGQFTRSVTSVVCP